MPAVASSEPCVICEVREPVMHSHHTIPQSRGGKDSRQIILCSSCHNILHAHAQFLVSRIRNPSHKREPVVFWPDPVHDSRAQPWVEVLVKAFLTDVPNPDTLEHLVSAKIDGKTWHSFKLLAADLGTSQEAALVFCIKNTLATKGITHHEQQKARLWFLPPS